MRNAEFGIRNGAFRLLCRITFLRLLLLKLRIPQSELRTPRPLTASGPVR